MRRRTRLTAGFGLALLALAGAAPASRGAFLTFDERPAGVYPSTLYAADGVVIQMVDIPDAVAVGGLLTPTGVTNSFTIAAFPTLSPTPPNILYQSNLRDYLLTFTAAVTEVGITTDITPEALPGEVVRLIALDPTGVPGQYRIAGFAEATEGPLGVNLSVDLGRPFSAAIIQVTTESEGFDNLRFTPAALGPAAVPEPSSLLLAGVGAVGLITASRRRTGQRAIMD